jgi:hypothetical protein
LWKRKGGLWERVHYEGWDIGVIIATIILIRAIFNII